MERHSIKAVFIYLFRCLLLTLIMWLALSYSLFNTSDKLDKYMQDLFNTHLGQLVYPDASMNSVAVLLLTDQIVDGALAGQWPAPYGFHAAVLDDLLQHRPKAVFIDFYWMNRLKPGGDYLVHVLEKYRSAGITVYLAAPSSKWFEGFWPELQGLAIPVSASVSLDPTDFVSRQYPQTHNGLPSAAFVMVEDLTHEPLLTDSRGDMDIFWGTAKNPKNWAWMEQADVTEGGWLGTFTDGFSGVGTAIPYTTTVFVRDLINPVGETEEAAQADLSNHLQDHVVIYGANLSGIQDYVFLPTRSVLPGAYYHAMAVDNLLTWRQGFKSDVANLTALNSSYLPLWLVHFTALLPLSIAFVWRFSRPPPPPVAESAVLKSPLARLKAGLVSWLLNSRFWLCSLAYVLLLCWFLFAVLDLSVATWVGFFGMVGVGVLVEKMDLVERVTSLPGKAKALYQECVKGNNDEKDSSAGDVNISGATGAVAASSTKQSDS